MKIFDNFLARNNWKFQFCHSIHHSNLSFSLSPSFFSIECANSPCQNGGECIDKINEFYCICEAGYNGTLCEIDINECRSKNCDNKTTDLCASSPCKNNGTCESGETWFRCKCAPGFDGLTCLININECASQPCAEGSTCIDGIGNFQCICPPSKRGKRCEICKYTLAIITKEILL